MNRKSFNERKLQVLKFLLKNPGVTSADIADAFGTSLANSSMILYRLKIHRLVDRKADSQGKFKKPYYKYSINEKGIGRLEYLTERQTS